MSAEIILMPARRSGFVRYCVGALADLTFVNRARKFTNLLGRHTDHLRAEGFDTETVDAYAAELRDAFWSHFPADRRSA